VQGLGKGVGKTHRNENRRDSLYSEILNHAVFIENVTTAYPSSNDAILKNISLKIPYNTISLITGPNGSGKTTLLELILGFLRPLTGKIYVLGYKMPRNARRVRLNTSYLPQDFMRSPEEPYTVFEVISMALAPYQKPFCKISKQDKRRIMELLEIVGLSDLAHHPIGKLSGGQQQRAMLVRALIRKPKLLLLDEPFSSIDIEGRHEFCELLAKLQNLYKTTIIIVSHIIDPIIEYSDLLIELKDGRVASNKWLS